MNQDQSPDMEWIIVAEDSLPNRTILIHLLKKLGYNIIECADGEAAWAAYQQRGQRQVVAVLSDIMMPHLDGIGLLKNIRSVDPNLPVVLITAVSEREYIIEARALNVNGYILKPVTFQRVSAKLKELFPERRFPNMQTG